MPIAVYVDFDDVLCETARALAFMLEREFRKTVAFEDIHTFDLGQSFGLDASDLQRLMELAHQPEFLGELAPVPGALEALRGWAAAGVEIHIVTGRPASTRTTSAAWLRNFDVPYSRLIFVDKYGRNLLPDGAEDAISLAELMQMRFALAVEDAPQMADFLVRNMPGPVAMIRRPWNARATIGTGNDPGQLHRCQDWAQILQQFPAPGV